jgi:hypothetical protein
MPDEVNEPSLSGFIDGGAAALGLPIDPTWRAAIEANLAATLRAAALFDTFALLDEVEPAPVFVA